MVTLAEMLGAKPRTQEWTAGEVWPSPSQLSRALGGAAELGLSIAPGSGEAMSATDAWNASGKGAEALQGGNYGQAASEYGNMLAAMLGALPGAGIIARGTKRGAAWMDRNMPSWVNSGLDRMMPANPQDTAYAIPAWHGSPHDFDEFKLDKIGTGEGAQVYGHGLYFAENPEVARSYREALSNKGYTIDDEPVMDNLTAGWAAAKRRGEDLTQQYDRYSDDATYWKQIADEKLATGKNPAMAVERHATAQANADALERVMRGNVASTNPGRLYHTELDVEPEDLLDWDSLLSQQGDVGRRVASIFGQVDGMKPSEDILTYRSHWRIGDVLEKARERGMSNADLSAALREAGIPGIRYLDQGSRGAGEGSRNFVIFDDKLVKVLGKE